MTETDDQNSSDSFTLHQCTLDDEDGALAVCLQTGNAGRDATLLFDDPKLLGYRYVSPYIHLAPDLAFVLKDSKGSVCGYVLAALHSDQFYQRYVDEWLPKMRKQYPTIPTERTKEDWEVIQGFHNDTVQTMKLFDGYPSHLHIDLIPRAQGKGYGTKMINHIENELKQRGSKGVHLEMSANNDRAFQFYTKLGFIILGKDQHALWLGKKLA